LADIRSDERLWFEKEKESFREEERKIRDSARARMAEAVDFLQTEALSTLFIYIFLFMFLYFKFFKKSLL
jgi:hypothetical protein